MIFLLMVCYQDGLLRDTTLVQFVWKTPPHDICLIPRKCVTWVTVDFFPPNHQWRRDKKNFDGNVDLRDPIEPKDGHDILKDIDSSVSGSHYFGKHSMQTKIRKRKRDESHSAWDIKSIFFNLPYWAHLKL